MHEKQIDTALYVERLTTINARLEDGDSAGDLQEYLTQGSVVYVFQLDEKVLGKIPTVWKADETLLPEEDARLEVEICKRALQRTLGMPHTEQLVVWDEETAMWCVEKADGVTLRQVDTTQYTAAHYCTLLDTVELLHAHEVTYEDTAANILYDPKAGFTLIDCGVDEDYEKLRKETDSRGFLLDNIGMLASQTLFATRYNDFCHGKIPDEAHVFQQVCSERYGKEFGENIVEIWRRQQQF